MTADRVDDGRSVASGTIGGRIARDSGGVRRGWVGRLCHAVSLGNPDANVINADVIPDFAQHGTAQRGVDVAGLAMSTGYSGHAPDAM